MTRYSSVHGISDARRLPRIGKLRLGVKKTNQNGKQYPAEVEYFVIDRPAADASAVEKGLYGKFLEVYGEKPRKLDVLIPAESREDFFPQSYKCYGAAKLKCIGDGESASRITPSGEYQPVAGGCPGPQACKFALSCGKFGKPGCAFSAALFVVLPKISLAGCFQIVTGSKTATIGINSSVDSIRQMFGKLSMLAYPGADGQAETVLRLVRRPTKLQYEGKSKVHFIMCLEPQITIDDFVRLRASGALGQGAPTSSAPALPAPGAQGLSETVVEQVVDLETGEVREPETEDAEPLEESGGAEEQEPAGDESEGPDDGDDIEDLRALVDARTDIKSSTKETLKKQPVEAIRRYLNSRKVAA